MDTTTVASETFAADIYLRRGLATWRVRQTYSSRAAAEADAVRIAEEHGGEVDRVRAVPARHYNHGINARG